ncbi:murein biosynthesis integral membrane protein MurJ [Faecalibacterium sp. An192]|uniref:murein biosynthesis integral membrane protein MurJ n=1 Tax=Faecalibacterium sp. An192 TaxID=1965581 RepID=UPI000B368EFD|nr:murein biosynthesis integral membrane protein MurJ [Faecalibacterium sp. An192]OUP28189.1 murein biosynthesis integral membrane protein MurJ [Faecalibacterium sp. An192]
MVQKREKSIATKVVELILAAFIAKGLGFVREMVLANYYGTSYVSDVFVAVQNIPAIIFTVFGTAVTTGFIPLYTEIKIRKNRDAAEKFANNVFNIFLLMSILLTTLGIVFSRQLVELFAGGFQGETFALCNQYAKIIMPTCIAIILVYVYNAYLQIEGYFNQNSLMNVPYNLIQIIFIVIGFYIGNVYILAVGLLLASFGQFIYLKILIKKKTDFQHRYILDFHDTNIKQMLILVGPVFVSTGVNQLNSIVDRSMASGLVEGSVSALNYSSEIANMVTQVVILSLTTILYPKMTELFARNDRKEKNSFTLTYINVVSLLVLPLSALIFAFSKEIVQILFGRGAFDEKTVLFVSRALKIYALGIVGASFRDVLNKVFYSMKDTKTPMINGIIAVGVNIGLNIVLVKRFEYLGLAFATSISATICTIALLIHMCKKMTNFKYLKAINTFTKAFFAMIFMYVGITILMPRINEFQNIIKCLIGGTAGCVIYLLVLFLLKEEFITQMVLKMKMNLKNKI